MIEEGGPPGPPPDGLPPGEPPGDRELWPWLLVLLGLVLAGIAAAWLISRDDDDKEARPATTLVTTVPGTTDTQPVTTVANRVVIANLLGIPVSTATTRLKRDGLRWQIRRVESTKPKNIVAAQEPGAGTQVAKNSVVRLDVSNGPPPVAVPDVIGLDRADAVAALENNGLEANVVVVPGDEPEGQVVAQDPAAGERAPRGSTVRLNISSGSPDTTPQTTTQATTATRPATTATTRTTSPPPPPPPPTTRPTTAPPPTTRPTTTTRTTAPPPPPPPPATTNVPNVTGASLGNAFTRLANAGLIGEVRYAQSQEPAGTVISQSPQAGTTARRGGRVRISVSLGPEPAQLVAVPNVSGLDPNDAQARLEQAGFTVVVVEIETTDPSRVGAVLEVQPASGTQAPEGSEVALYIGRATRG